MFVLLTEDILCELFGRATQRMRQWSAVRLRGGKEAKARLGRPPLHRLKRTGDLHSAAVVVRLAEAVPTANLPSPLVLRQSNRSFGYSSHSPRLFLAGGQFTTADGTHGTKAYQGGGCENGTNDSQCPSRGRPGVPCRA